MARLHPTPDHRVSRSLRPSLHHFRGRSGQRVLAKRSGSFMDTDRSLSSSSSSSDLEPVEVGVRDLPAESSTRSSIPHHSSTMKVSRSSVLVTPSAGMKLGHMLSLIQQDDVEFKQHPFFTEIHFSLMDGESRAMHPLPARRLRSLIAFAHHLDEADRSECPRPNQNLVSVDVEPKS